MTDNHTVKQRSYNMAQIKSANTHPEEMVRKYLFSKGFRYRKNFKKLPGKPDIVLPKYRVIVFVHGCFWHMHNCSRFKMPKSNLEYWETKLRRNVDRDNSNRLALENLGWKVLVIWECELKKECFDETMEKLINEIKRAN